MWLDILRKEVAAKGPQQVAKELGTSRSTVDMVCQGKYPASTAKVEERIKTIYGNNGGIDCPVLGEITPNACAEKWKLAKKIGGFASNPETIRLYASCKKCSVRK